MRDEDINLQCLLCHLIFAGPGTGRNPGRKIRSLGATPADDSEHVDDKHPFNCSHGFCPRHEGRMMEAAHREVYRERDERRVRDELERRHFWRRRPQGEE